MPVTTVATCLPSCRTGTAYHRTPPGPPVRAKRRPCPARRSACASREALPVGLPVTSVVMTALLAAVLVLQFRARRYVPSIYWLAVVLISVVGTLITDNLTDNPGVIARRHDRPVRRGPGRPLRPLVPLGADAVDPRDRHDPPRGVLLAGHSVHLRPGHRGRGPAGRAAPPRAPSGRRGSRPRRPPR